MVEPVAAGSLWLTGQRPLRAQRAGRYLPPTEQHPTMLPAVAVHAIAAYTRPGDLVVDPMCGAGTTLVEALEAGRDSIGVDIAPESTALARGNVAFGYARGLSARAWVLTGDATDLTGLLPPAVFGTAQLVLTSPPYGRTTFGRVRATTDAGRADRDHVCGGRRAGSGAQLLDGWSRILAGCRKVLRPGGFLVFTCRPVRRACDDLLDVPGGLFTAALAAGFEPVERCVALLVPVRDRRLAPQASMVALMAARRARAAGIPVAVIAHEDVYVLRRPR